MKQTKIIEMKRNTSNSTSPLIQKPLTRVRWNLADSVADPYWHENIIASSYG